MTRQDGRDGQVEGTASCESTPGSAWESALGVVVSCAFWLCLATSAALFALVVLAPKLLTYDELQAEAYANQVRLVTLEGQVQRLEGRQNATQRRARTARPARDHRNASVITRKGFHDQAGFSERITVQNEAGPYLPLQRVPCAHGVASFRSRRVADWSPCVPTRA